MTLSLLVIAIIISNKGWCLTLLLLSLLSFDDTNIHCLAQNAHGIYLRNGSSWCCEQSSIMSLSSCWTAMIIQIGRLLYISNILVHCWMV
ncbi:hypothetical protein K501DRAFT_312130 [Backusella circina FSU 941]|nr:hypothetical protein K501DRAFT_312130 [Backusella circina FSU 941]